jgi:hypothetical protein
MTRDQILIILLIIVIGISIYKLLKRKDNAMRAEEMTLKLFCDERDRSCNIACTRSNGVFDRKCYIDCQVNSPIC